MFGKTIGEIPGEAAARFGDKTALIFGGRKVSFAEIDRQSSRVASGLRALGVEPGDRVTLYAQNSVEWIVSYYAIAKAGGVLNPINVMLTPDEVAYVVKDCGAKVLFTTADRAAPILPLKERQRASRRDHSLVGADAPGGATSFDSLARVGVGDDFEPVDVEATGIAFDDLLHVGNDRGSRRARC